MQGRDDNDTPSTNNTEDSGLPEWWEARRSPDSLDRLRRNDQPATEPNKADEPSRRSWRRDQKPGDETQDRGHRRGFTGVLGRKARPQAAEGMGQAANKALGGIADPNDVSQALRGNPRAIANTAAAAALTALGVPPALARKLGPIVIRAIAITVAFAMLLGFAVFAGGFADNADKGVQTTEAYESAPEEIRSAFEASARRHGIPVRILLAIAKSQTNYGQLSPYDGIDRTRTAPADGEPRSVFPTVQPAIGDASKNEGLGMFLLTEAGAQQLEIDPQDTEAAVDALAERIRELKNDLAGNYSGWQTDAELSDGLWTTVIAQLPLVDTAADLIDCAVPSGDPTVGDAVSTIFQCVLIRQASIAVPRVVAPDTAGGRWTVTYTTGEAAASQLTREGLAVAWASVHKDDGSWPKLSELRCKGLPSSVFPMSKAAWTAYTTKHTDKVANPCDVQQNVTAMAEWLAAQAKRLPSKLKIDPTKPYSVESLLWAAVPLAGGNARTASAFAKSGAFVPYTSPAACRAQLQTALLNLSTAPEGEALRTFQQAADRTEQLRADAQRVIDALSLASTPTCASSGRSPSAVEWYAEVADAARGILSALTEELDVPGADPLAGSLALKQSFLNGVITIAGDLSAAGVAPVAVVGTDAAIARLSPVARKFPVPPVTASQAPLQVTGLATRILDNILSLGGLIPDDPRAGQQPSGLFALTTGIGIAVEMVFDLPVIDTAADSRLARPTAGCSNGDNAYMLKEMIPRWTALCRAAATDGVDLRIGTAWRSLQQQQALFKVAGSKTAATPGKSPHQKGESIDMDIAKGNSPADNKDPGYQWMHTIVGCIDIAAEDYQQLSAPLSPEAYVASAVAPCGKRQPVKRVQTFGLVPLCKGYDEDWSDPAVVLCGKYGDDRQSTLGGRGEHYRERWHVDLGVILIAGGGTGVNCLTGERITVDPADKQSVAVAVRTTFYCRLLAEGFTSLAPIGNSERYPIRSQVKNLAEQIAAEAVVVSFCESSLNPKSGAPAGTYQGLFQLGKSEFARFSNGQDDALRTDALANIAAAAEYWLASFYLANGRGWTGWHPWAVVNTDYGGANDAVVFPILGRFHASEGPHKGEYGAGALPNWALSPETNWGPRNSCGAVWGVPSSPWLPAPAKAYAGAVYSPADSGFATQMLPSGVTSVGVVGDSLTVGAKTDLIAQGKKAGLTVTVQAKNGIGVSKVTAAQVRDLAKTNGAVIVALGTNDSAGGISYATAAGRVKLVVDSVPSTTRLYWVTVYRDSEDAIARAGADVFNKAIRQAAKTYPNLTVLDWDGYVKEHIDTMDTLIAKDRIHLTGPGYERRAKWVVSELTTE